MDLETNDTTPARPVSKTRRTEGIRTQGRAARVVEGVLSATVEELSKRGYAGLRVDEVAARSGVNKTTIYRRWPTKADLVAAAVARVTETVDLPDTGSLENDIVTMMVRVVEFSKTPIGSGIIRMVQKERTHQDVAPIGDRLRAFNWECRLRLVNRAIERGELPADSNAEIIADLFFTPIFTRLVTLDLEVTEDYIRDAAAIVLLGARANYGVQQ
jgi:AcrR family transcriptional regulator